MTNKLKQVMVSTTPPCNPNRGARGFTKQAAAKCLKHGGIFVVYDQDNSNPLGIEVFRLGPCTNDEVTERYSAIHLRLHIPSVVEYVVYDLKLKSTLTRRSP